MKRCCHPAAIAVLAVDVCLAFNQKQAHLVVVARRGPDQRTGTWDQRASSYALLPDPNPLTLTLTLALILALVKRKSRSASPQAWQLRVRALDKAIEGSTLSALYH